MSKKVHGNKEAKKPKQATRSVPPPAGQTAALVPPGGARNRPHTGK